MGYQQIDRLFYDTKELNDALVDMADRLEMCEQTDYRLGEGYEYLSERMSRLEAEFRELYKFIVQLLANISGGD